MKKYLIIFSFSLLTLFVEAQQNLITNGGFENGTSGWSLEFATWAKRVTDAKNGRYALEVYGGSRFSAKTAESNFNPIAVEENTEYTFSYWHKGEFKNYGKDVENIFIEFTWYKGDKKIKTETMNKHTTTSAKDKWQKKEFKVSVPSGIDRAGLTIRIDRNDISKVKIDDISMVFSQKLEEKISAPTNFKYNNFQREVELFWDKENIEGLQWEVVVDNQNPILVKENQYIITQLKPQSNHSAKVRAIKNGEKSDYTSILYFSTNDFKNSKDDINRIPHLRTIANDKSSSKNLRLFYNDLYDLNAKITYFIDGVETQPQGDTLVFPKLGRQSLKVLIQESEDLQWELTYDITVK